MRSDREAFTLRRERSRVDKYICCHLPCGPARVHVFIISMLRIDPILYVIILYSAFLAVPLLFSILYIIFKVSEVENSKALERELKRKASELVWEVEHGVVKDKVSAPIV